MSTKFGGYYPVVRREERERMVFVASIGLLFALVIIFVVVLNFRDDAVAKQDRDQVVTITPQSVGTVALVAPARYVRAGTKLSEIEFKQIFWQRNQVPEGSVIDQAELRDLFASQDLYPDAPIIRTKLTKSIAQASLPVTPGNRAVTIPVDESSSLEGHALPGTRVDIVLTYTDAGDLSSKVIVQNARVLSYGGETKADLQMQPARMVRQTKKTITLDVAPEDALKIATARELGRLSLFMRSSDDDKATPTDSIDKSDFKDKKKSDAQSLGSNSCNKGTVKMGGKEFVVGCNGRIEEVNPE